MKNYLSMGLLALVLVGCGGANKLSNFDKAESELSQMKKLSSNEIKDLVTNKSIDFHVKGNVYTITHKDDGKISSNSLRGTWYMDKDGIKCINSDKGGVSCVNVYKSNETDYYTTKPNKTKILSAFVIEK